MADVPTGNATRANDATSVAGPQPVPPMRGWSGAAMAIHAVRRLPIPVLLRLDVVGWGSVTVDTARNEYVGDLEPATSPTEPDCVLIATHQVTPGASLSDARDLDEFLWFVGWHAFDDGRASWLWADDRYRLVRWPNVRDATADEVRMLAALSNAYLGPDELAHIVGLDRGRAQRAINALTLMGALDTSSHAAPPQPTSEHSRSTGLFARLRRRLGFE